MDEIATEVRRPLTVVFVDVVGSTELSIVMEPEEYADVINRYRRISGELIERHGGFIPRDEGDGRFIWFGWPAAHDDDAGRAVELALDLTDAITPLSADVEKRVGRTVGLRVGIHTGPVIITHAGGADRLDVDSATVNFAAKVQQAAAPGEILVSEATAGALLHGCPLEPAGQVSIGELEGGIEVFRVVGRTPGAGTRPPLVGRNAELDQLVSTWQAVAGGRAATVVVSGPPGIGKTRLIEELCDVAGPGRSIAVQGDRDRTAVPFDAVVAALPDLDPAGERAGVLAAAMSTLRSRASADRLLLVVEDAQWLDPSSAELVAELARQRLPGLMLVVTARDAASGGTWPGAETVELTPLEPAAATELVAEVRAGPLADDEQRSILLDRAAGNPFYLIWLGRTQREDSYLGVRRLLRSRTGAPAVIQQAVRSQIDQAGVDDAVTTTAAVIGTEFSVNLLARALERPAASVQTDLAALVRHGILRPSGAGDDRYRFTHSLVRDQAYDLLLGAASRDRHGRVADVLVADGTQDHAEIGRHQDLAGRPLEAARSKLAAARACRLANAYAEGAGLVERVIELVGEAPELPDAIEAEARALHATFAAAVHPDSYAAGSSDLTRVHELLDADADVGASVMAKTGEWAAAMLSGDLRSSIRLLYEVRRTARRQFPMIEVCNRNARGTHATYRGRYAHAERLVEGSLAEIGRDGLDPWLLANWGTLDDPIALAYSLAPPVLYQRGRRLRALQMLERAWQRAESVSGGIHTRLHVAANAASFWTLAGEGSQAVQLGEEVAALAGDNQLDFWVVTGQLHARLGQALIEPTPPVIEQLEADAVMLDAFAPLAAGRVHVEAARAWLTLGDPGRAGKSLDAADTVATTTGIHYLDAEGLRLRARTASSDARRVALLVEAAELAQRQGARRYRLRALADLARLDPGARVAGSDAASALEGAIGEMPETDADGEVEQAMVALATATGR